MSLTIEKNVSLSELTTLKIGGEARFFAAATDENQIVEALDFADKSNLKTFILGGGSNVLISDEGFGGLVLQIALKGISTFAENGKTVNLSVGAGEDWDSFCEFCVGKNLQGVECLSGIPGLIGGTPVQNVGAYGQEVSGTIITVRCFDRKSAEFVELTNAECGFAYRTSIFNTSEKNRYIVTAVTFALRPGGEPNIVYKDLREFFGDKTPTLPETRQAVLRIRAAKSMVINAADPNSKSAGSFFKNPIVTREKYTEIENRAKLSGIESVPFFKADAENVKIPAAWLIENSGFDKGHRRGTVGLSTKHTLAIVNFGGAAAKDILELKSEIQAKVKKIFGVELLPEPIFVGF